MATIKHVQTGQRVWLTSTHQVGRAKKADLQIRSNSVSSVHALFQWTDGQWQLRDLGSSNGTTIDGQRLSPGERLPIEVGQLIGFGSTQELWSVLDLMPPSPLLVATDGEVVILEGSVRVPGAVAVYVLRDTRGIWWLHTEWARSPLVDGEPLQLGGRTWVPHLHAEVGATQRDGESPLRLRFRVARGEQHVELDLLSEARTKTLAARAHTYLLLTLARLRIKDRKDGLPELECGWTHTDVVADMLRSNRAAVYTQVYRARRQLEGAGFSSLAEFVVEHRRTNAQLRLGVGEVEVVNP